MKSFIKIALAAGAIALSCTCTALAAPTADSLASEIAQPGGFYTLYKTMPISDFRENWDGIAGWKHERKIMQALPDRCNDYFERSYKLDGKDVTERVFVQSDLKKGYVRSFNWSLSSNSQQVIERVFVRMYDKFAEIYPGFTEQIPKGYTQWGGKNPRFVDTDSRDSFIFLINRGRPKDPTYPRYAISLSYSVGY